MNPFIKKILCWGMGLLSTMQTLCVANITFTNPATKLFINPTNSKMYIGNASKVTGWSQRSVVKNFGNNASNSWLELYANGSVVGQLGQGGVPAVDKPARTTLVDANSNALCAFDPTTAVTLRANSNLLLYTARTHSSSIWVLRSRADSTSRDVRTTSNALLVLSSAIRTTSSAVNLIYQNMAVPTADAIDGTVFAKYCTNHYVFHNNAGSLWSARGWVRFNNGFTVMPQASVIMDTLVTVSGGMDLRDTGKLILNNDLYLAHNVTLTNGGNIQGRIAARDQVNTIFMGGDLKLAFATYPSALHIYGDWLNNSVAGDLVIDGCGHTLDIGAGAQIFVDTKVTLTLRNMIIKTSARSLSRPPIQLASHSSKLALDNVVFDLGADFRFVNGQIFIHDDVAVTGTSAFIYNSPKPSYITSGATWSFEEGTTFSVAPATYTDQPFTAGTATSNNFVVLADQSAALSLNSCSLKTTFTGARLTKGMVLFDNKVAIDTQAGVEVSGLQSGVAGVGGNDVAWSPDGKMVVSGGNVYAVSGGIFGPNLLTASFTSGANAAAWSPDGRYLAVGGSAGGGAVVLYLYRVSGVTFNLITTIINPPTSIRSIAWSPDGKFLAVGAGSSNRLSIYRFDGWTLNGIWVGTPGSFIAVYAVAWNPSGEYFALCASSGDLGDATFQVWRFDGVNFSLVASRISEGYNSYGKGLAWSPDGRFLAQAFYDNDAPNYNQLRLYSFNGSALTTLPTQSVGNFAQSVSWGPTGKFVMLGGAGFAYVYTFDGYNTSFVVGGGGQYVAVSPDGSFLLTEAALYPLTFANQSASYQGFSNGLLFGDKVKGVNFDANVQVLSSATVKVRGKIKDDSV